VRISARAFLGPVICGDTAWIETTLDYLQMGVRTAFVLQVFPRILFPLQRWFPLCRRARKHIDTAGDILRPIINRRRLEGKSEQDAISWFDEAAAGEKYDPVLSQLSLSWASTHTTADTVTKVITHLAQRSDVILDLREEIIGAIKKNNGLTKSALSQMHLLDSILKESQRLEPLASGISLSFFSFSSLLLVLVPR
jgi:cytochrome P450